MKQELANVFCKGQDSKYFRLCGHMAVSVTTTELYHYSAKTAICL